MSDHHRRIFIGDVHGYYDGLMTLLEAISPNSDDQVYFLGDLIDRGPQSAQVVEFVQQSGYSCLLGNHEQMLLDALASRIGVPTFAEQNWLYSGGFATVTSYKEATIPQSHVEWMSQLPTHLDLGDIWLAHAGLDPRMPLAEQTAEQLCWVREEFHSIKEPYFLDKLIIVGHTITFTFPGVTPGNLAKGQGWLDIDTGAYHRKSGWLTGLDVTNSQVYQVNVFEHQVRTLPLKAVMTQINPAQMRTRRLLV
ncbi:MAG: serine/threonine protein phosphatase [Chroococcidiopsidaceae cyanobacterium CP_BM_RX_35]|nr:serine/threonine protein phosphatase [Chroococcidiopsidaceae cyanobacterium CP_BM_RX_35]